MSLAWTAGKDVAVAKVQRAPGLKGKKAQVVYSGKARKFVDRKIGSGKRYWYEITRVRPGGQPFLEDDRAEAFDRHLSPPPTARW